MNDILRIARLKIALQSAFLGRAILRKHLFIPELTCITTQFQMLQDLICNLPAKFWRLIDAVKCCKISQMNPCMFFSSLTIAFNVFWWFLDHSTITNKWFPACRSLVSMVSRWFWGHSTIALCIDPHCKVSIGQYTKMCTSPLIFSSSIISEDKYLKKTFDHFHFHCIFR